MVKTSVILPFVKETKGALLYALPDRTGTVVSNVYVRKDKIEKVAGAWPVQITVTVEVGT